MRNTAMARNGKKRTTGSVRKKAAPPPLGIELKSPVEHKLRSFIDENLKTRPLMVVAPDLYKGKTLALCGAGPSLSTQEITGADHIFACNSALPYLVSRGVTVTGGVGIDQTPGLLNEWKYPPNVPYYVASSCDPALIRHLRANRRHCIFFHNFVGLVDEDGKSDEIDYYCATWPTTYMVGKGFSVVDRFIGVAEWMGFSHVDVYGADHAFGPGDVAHASGETATEAYTNPLILEGEIDGRLWRTRPDMLLAAVELARRVRDSDGYIRLVGDTLPGHLMDKDDHYLDQVARALGEDELAEGRINLNYGVQ